VLSLFVAESVIVLAEGYFFRIPGHLFYIGWPNVLIAIFLLLLIGCSNIAFAEQKRADNKLRRAQEENLTLAAVAERERIARDLHDVLGHTLSVIVLKAELAGRLIEHDPQRAAHEISDVEKTARTAPFRGHGPQLSLRSNRQAGHLQSHRRRPHRPRQGLALKNLLVWATNLQKHFTRRSCIPIKERTGDFHEHLSHLEDTSHGRSVRHNNVSCCRL
jgi:signal transduction histidine kinase